MYTYTEKKYIYTYIYEKTQQIISLSVFFFLTYIPFIAVPKEVPTHGNNKKRTKKKERKKKGKPTKNRTTLQPAQSGKDKHINNSLSLPRPPYPPPWRATSSFTPLIIYSHARRCCCCYWRAAAVAKRHKHTAAAATRTQLFAPPGNRTTINLRKKKIQKETKVTNEFAIVSRALHLHNVACGRHKKKGRENAAAV